MAATIVLFPLFAVVTFMFVQGVVWQTDRQVAAAAADRASAAVALYGSSAGDARSSAETRMASAGLRDISVSISRGAEVTVVVVSGTARGILPGTSVTVTARSATPTERFIAP
ncbi:hypothetical protein BH24ACT5_BH24ACT5_05180 [soil metagenome]